MGFSTTKRAAIRRRLGKNLLSNLSDLCTSSIIDCDKMASSYAPTAIIIGAGPGGISMAYRLKHELGFNDFLVISILGSPIMQQVLTCCRYTKNWMVWAALGDQTAILAGKRSRQETAFSYH